MNEQLQQALTELITKATTGIDSASEFILAEMPDVIQQLLMWHGVKNIVYFAMALIIPIIWALFARKMWVYYNDEDYPDRNIFGSNPIPFFSLLLSCGLVGIIFAININIEWLQIWIAPKVWLIEYAANLVK